ncbi:hypothetical protein [Desulfovulcanus sp.]
MSTLYTGDDWEIKATLKLNGEPVSLSPEDKVFAAIVDISKNKPFVGPVELAREAVGSDFENGVVVAEFSHEQTKQIEPGSGLVLEIQIDRDGHRQTYRLPISVEKGYLTILRG